LNRYHLTLNNRPCNCSEFVSFCPCTVLKIVQFAHANCDNFIQFSPVHCVKFTLFFFLCKLYKASFGECSTHPSSVNCMIGCLCLQDEICRIDSWILTVAKMEIAELILVSDSCHWWMPIWCVISGMCTSVAQLVSSMHSQPLIFIVIDNINCDSKV
jgi:hypothetical protein